MITAKTRFKNGDLVENLCILCVFVIGSSFAFCIFASVSFFCEDEEYGTAVAQSSENTNKKSEEKERERKGNECRPLLQKHFDKNEERTTHPTATIVQLLFIPVPPKWCVSLSVARVEYQPPSSTFFQTRSRWSFCVPPHSFTQPRYDIPKRPYRPVQSQARWRGWTHVVLVLMPRCL